MLTIIKRHRTAPGQEEGPLQRVKIGKLFIVDLAGSERLKKSLSTGAHSSSSQFRDIYFDSETSFLYWKFTG